MENPGRTVGKCKKVGDHEYAVVIVRFREVKDPRKTVCVTVGIRIKEKERKLDKA
jgi:hypothetical protein